jgi:hypothetical protein
MVRKNRKPANADRWKVFRAIIDHVSRPVGEPYRDEDSLSIAWLPAATRKLAQATAAVVILDGTGILQEIEQALGTTPTLFEAVTAEQATVHRTIIARNATRRDLLSGDWTRATRRGAIHEIVNWTLANVPKNSKVLLCTFRDLCTGLAEGWSGKNEQTAELLEPLRGKYELAFTYYGSPDTNGSNDFETFDASISLGDPRSNIAQAKASGANVEARAAGVLEQFHGRLRPVHRERVQLWSLHVGEIAPSTQWDRDNVLVVQPEAKRPRRKERVQSEALAIVRHFGSELAAHEYLARDQSTKLSRNTLARAVRGDEVSGEVCDKVRNVYSKLTAHVATYKEEERRASIDSSTKLVEQLPKAAETLQNPPVQLAGCLPLALVPAPTAKPLAPWQRQREPLGASTVDESTEDGSTPVHGASSDPGGLQVPS